MSRPVQDLEVLGEIFFPVFDAAGGTAGAKPGQFRLYDDGTNVFLEVYSLKSGAWHTLYLAPGTAPTWASGTGSVASGDTTDVITHGLGITPSLEHIHITWGEQGSNDYGRWWVDTITSTQFTVNVSADPGASNLDFGWSVMTTP